MENVLLDRSSGSFEFNPKMMAMSRNCRWRGLGTMPATPYNRSFPPTCQPPYHHQVHRGGAWSSVPALPYARPAPAIYSSPSLPLLPSNQPPLLPLPPTATKYATFPSFLPASPPPPPPPQRAAGVRAAAAANATAPAAAQTGPAPRQRERRRRPAKTPPPPTVPPTEQKKKPLQRAEPLPPAPVMNEMLDDLEQEVARHFVQDLLHALAPPPSSLPLPRFSLVTNASRVAAAPSCNAEAAAAAGVRGLLRL